MTKNLKHNEVASRGGRATLLKYGKEHFSKLGAKSAKVRKNKFGSDYYKRLSMSGVAARKEKREKDLARKETDMPNLPEDGK